MLVHQNTNSRGNYNYNAFIYENCEWYYHFHSNYELACVLSGKVTLMVDMHTETLREGDFALILPNQLHSYSTPETSKVWIGVFSRDFVYAFDEKINNKASEHARFLCEDTVRKYLLRELIEKDTQEVFLLKSCFYAACDQYLRSAPLVARESDSDDLLHRMLDYVSTNYRSDITLRKMAHDLGFEYHYLSRRFHGIFNTNFCMFVNQYRVNYANELLEQNFGSMSIIAFECGFQSVRAFNDAYRRFFGSVPSRYNQNVQKK